MSSRNTSIELNGKRYDTRTGKIIQNTTTKPKNTTKQAKLIKNSVGTIDGFTKKPTLKTRTATSSNAIHSKTEKSKTLMRRVVKKPKLESLSSSPEVIKHRKNQRISVDPTRAKRAKIIAKNPLVSRFGAVTELTAEKTKPSKVKAPVAPPAVSQKNDANLIKEKITPTERVLISALQDSKSHKQSRPLKATRRQKLGKKLKVNNKAINFAAAGLSVILLAGFIVYQNIPNLSMQVATARAGVNGSLPRYNPSGFGLAGPIKYENGNITLRYASRSDNRTYEINQKSTNWNSDSLLENFVADGKKNYQTYHDSGKTIYLYDENNATWVDGGVWYQITGNSALSSDQLLRVTASM